MIYVYRFCNSITWKEIKYTEINLRNVREITTSFTTE